MVRTIVTSLCKTSWHNNIFTVSDCCSLETFGKETGTVEIHPLSCSAVWCRDGDAYLCPHCIAFMVSICINVPNSSHVQPGFQSGVGDLTNPCWKQPQHRPMMLHELDAMSVHKSDAISWPIFRWPHGDFWKSHMTNSLYTLTGLTLLAA